MSKPTYEELIQKVKALEKEKREQKTGDEKQEIIGQPLTVLMPESFIGHHKKAMADHAKTGKSRVIG